MKSILNRKVTKPLALGAFVLGIFLLLVPLQGSKKVEKLPLTGIEPTLEIELTVDKEHVQRDDPAENAQVINYQLKVHNTADCVETPLNTVLTFDKSGSMIDLINDAKEAGKIFVSNLDFNEDKAAIVTYDDQANLSLGLSTNESELLSTISDIRAGGMTNIGDAILTAREELTADDNYKTSSPIIIIFTDGRPNRPIGLDYAKQYALDQAKEAKAQGIRIISIAYGAHADQELMKEIASAEAGSYYYAPTGEDMKRIYSALSENLQGASPDTQATVDFSHVNDIVSVVHSTESMSFQNNKLSWKIGTLQCQESILAKFSANVTGEAVDLDLIDLIAVISNSTNYAGEHSLNSNNVLTTIHAPVFDISKTDNKEIAMPGEELNYILNIANLGTGNAYGVEITDTLPGKYFELLSSSISDNGILNGNQISWDNNDSGYILDGTFEPTQSKWQNSLEFMFSGAVDDNLKPGLYLIENEVELTTTNGYSQTAIDETEVPYAPDLKVEKNSDPEIYTYPGGEVVYTLTVTNIGEQTATDIRVTDDFDEQYIIVATGQGEILNGTIIFRAEEIAPGASQTFSYKTRIVNLIPGNSQEIPNTARVTSSEPDVDPSNNSDSHEIIATLNPVLEITKTSDKTTYTLDEEIEYTILIENNSNADAYKLVLEDKIPSEFDYIPGSSTLDGRAQADPTGTHNLVWSLTDLAKGESAVLKFQVRPNNICVPENYLAEAEITWRNENGAPFDNVKDDCIVAIVDSQDMPDVPVQEEDDSTLEQLVDDLKVLGASLVNTGEGLIILKTFIGLLLALPLPLILIFEKKKKNKKNSSKKKKNGQKN